MITAKFKMITAKQFIKEIDVDGQEWSDDTELLAIFFEEYAKLYHENEIKKNSIEMKKEFTKKDYDKYMTTINRYIKKAEIVINDLPKFKEASRLSFDDWVKYQKGETKNT